MRRSVSALALLERRRQRLAVEEDLALHRRQQPGDDPRQRRLARAGFAHHRDRAAARHRHRHVVQHPHGVAIGGGHILDLQDRLAGRLLLLAELAHRPQRLGVVLARAGQHLAGRRFLDRLAVAQHHDAVGHLRHHREVVGDVDGGGVELLDDVADRRQHLDLGGDVERRRRLVEDDEVGPAGHGHGGHGPLQLAARDLVRIAEADLVRDWAAAGGR